MTAARTLTDADVAALADAVAKRPRTRAELEAKHAAVPAHVRAFWDAALRATLERLLRNRAQAVQPARRTA